MKGSMMMDVEQALMIAHESERVALTLAREVDRLRGELLSANAEQERLEAQLQSVRAELAATVVRIAEWDRVITEAQDELVSFLPADVQAHLMRIDAV